MDHGSKSGTPCEAQTQPHAPVPERAHAHSHAQTQVQEQAEGFASGAAPTTWLVYGGTSGWIGQKMVQLVRARPQCRAVCASARIECRDQVEAELDRIKPDYVINAAGLTGRPNVDWCEDHKEDTILVNVVGTINLLDACYRRDIHVTNFATGCIYNYDEKHPIGGKGFTEEDVPNFQASFYSYTKVIAEKLAKEYSNVLTLRLRMPISDDLHPRNFVTKISSYKRIVNVPNSMTVLTDLLPIALAMALKNLCGVYNFTNPGAISHNEVMELFKKHVCPEVTWENFDMASHDLVVKAKRSNNTLCVEKLLAHFPDIPDIHTAVEEAMQRMHAELGTIAPPEKS